MMLLTVRYGPDPHDKCGVPVLDLDFALHERKFAQDLPRVPLEIVVDERVTISVIGLPRSLSRRRKMSVMPGVKFLIQKSSPRKIVAICVLSRRFFKSLLRR